MQKKKQIEFYAYKKLIGILILKCKKNKTGVSVSKKLFKKAVDRNKIKRILRVCYQLNKKKFKPLENKKYKIIIFYRYNKKSNIKEISLEIVGIIDNNIKQIKLLKSKN